MSELKLWIARILFLGMPFTVHSAAEPCDLLTQAEVATVLPNPPEPRRREALVAPNGGVSDHCSWSRNGLLERLALDILVSPEENLKETFDWGSGEAIENLGDRAIYDSRWLAPGSIVVLVGQTVITLTFSDPAGAEQKKSALLQLARRVLDRL